MRKILYWLSPRPIFALLGKGYQLLMKQLEKIPGFPRYREISGEVTQKIFGIVKFPGDFEETIDPFLDIEKGRKMDPAVLGLVFIVMVVLGVYPSNLGHLDTAPGIWQILPIVSGFNPYIGLISGILFSAADWVGKMIPIFEDVYGANFGDGFQNYAGARVGYLLAYTTIIFTGILPGILSRVFRWVLGDFLKKIFKPKAVKVAALIAMMIGAAGALAYLDANMAILGFGTLPVFAMMVSGGGRYPGGRGEGEYPGGGYGGSTCSCGQHLPPGAWSCGICGNKTNEAKQHLANEEQAAQEAASKQAAAQEATTSHAQAAEVAGQYETAAQQANQTSEAYQTASANAQAQKNAAEQAVTQAGAAQEAAATQAATAQAASEQAATQAATAQAAAHQQAQAAQSAKEAAEQAQKAAADAENGVRLAGENATTKMLEDAEDATTKAAEAQKAAQQAEAAAQSAAQDAAAAQASAQTAAAQAAADQQAAAQAVQAHTAAEQALAQETANAQAMADQATQAQQAAQEATAAHQNAANIAQQYEGAAQAATQQAQAAQLAADQAHSARLAAEQAAAEQAAAAAQAADQAGIPGGDACGSCGVMVPIGSWNCMACGANTPELDAYLQKKAAEEAAQMQGSDVVDQFEPGMPSDDDMWGDALATFASILGASVGIVASHEWAKHVGNYGAFYALRADADVSCRALSEGNYGELQQQAPLVGAGAGLMPPGAAQAVTPGTPPPPPPPPGMTPPPTGPVPPSYLNEYLGEGKQGDTKSAYKETEDGRTVAAGYIYDEGTGGWREATAGESDGQGQIWDAKTGVWQGAAGAAADAQLRADTKAWQDEQRRKTADREFDYQKELDAKAKELTEKQKAREAKEAAEADRLKKQEEYRAARMKEGETLEDAKARMQAEQDGKVEAQASAGGLKDQAWDFVSGSAKDSVKMAGGMVRDVVMAPKHIYNAVTDPENIEIVRQTVSHTVKDLMPWNLPSSVGGATKRIYTGGTEMASGLYKLAKEDPILLAKTLTGYDNWETAFDPNTPPNERGWRALYGAVDLALNIGEGGAHKAGQLLDKANDLRRTMTGADKAADTAKLAKTVDKAADTSRAGKVIDKSEDAASLAAREEKAYLQAQKRAQGKVDELTEAVKSGDQDRIRKATIECQQDKNALYQMNREKGKFQSEIGAMDEHLMKRRDPNAPRSPTDSLAQKVDDDVIDALKMKDKELGHGPYEYETVYTTNTKGADELQGAAHDLDRAYRRKKPGGQWEDVPTTERFPDDTSLKEVYDQRVRKHAGASADEMDFVNLDGRDAEAYGFKAKDSRVEEVLGGEDDLNKLLNRKQVGTNPDGTPIFKDMGDVADDATGLEKMGRHAEDLKDAEGAAKTISHKAEHWYEKADDLRDTAEADLKAGKITQAQADEMLAKAAENQVEGMRQTSKQIKNQVKNRWEAAREAIKQDLPPGRNIDQVMPSAKMDRLTEAADIMEKGRKHGWSPSKIDAELMKELGTTSAEVSQQSGQMVEALQKLKPTNLAPGVPGAPVPPSTYGSLKVSPLTVDRVADVASGGDGEGAILRSAFGEGEGS